MKKYYFFITILFWSLLQKDCLPNIYINELMAVNVLSFANSEGNYEDWIELYNSGDQSVDLAGYYLSNNNGKWQLPSGFAEKTTIPAKGFLVIIADGNYYIPMHANFSLDKQGEKLSLFARDGITVMDEVTFPEQLRDISYGRWQDGWAVWNYMHVISPGTINKPGYTSFTERPEIILESGFYTGKITVNIYPGSPLETVRYTIDGSDPKETSPQSTAGVEVNKTCIIKARSFRNGYLPGGIIAKSIFINEQHTFPVLSLITDPKNLYDPLTGIYIHDFDGRAWERYAEFEYFQGNNPGLHVPAGIRIQGNTGPYDYQKKSFRLFFRKGYGQDKLNYPLYAHDQNNFNTRLVLRSGYDDSLEPTSDGKNEKGTLLREPLITELWRRTGNMVSQSKLASLYINGSYHGIYDIKQSIDEEFIKTRLGYSDLDVMRTRWDSTELVYGSRSKWNELMNFFQNNTFESDEMLIAASKKLDLDNYISLMAFVHGAQYSSWAYGVFMFREKADDALWKFIIWDADRAFGDVSWNGFTTSVNPVGNTFNSTIMTKLLQNAKFKDRYINRTADILNSVLTPEAAGSIIDSLASAIRSEIQAEAFKWNFSPDKWEQNVTALKTFTEQRPDIVRSQFLTQFSLTGVSSLTLETENSGYIQVNTITPDHYPWTGKYFNGITVTLKASAPTGYIFAGWDDSTLLQSDSINITLTGDRNIKAIFKKLEASNLEVIAPASVPGNHDIPAVVRIRNNTYCIDPVDQSPVLLSTGGVLPDTLIKIKRGAGSGLLRIKGVSGFTLNVSKENSLPVLKSVTISAVDNEFYSGTLPTGEIVWDNSRIRNINNNLAVPAATILRIKRGTWILISKNVNVYVQGKIIVEGSKDEPVVITSETSDAWGGMEFNGGEADFNYCIVTNGGGDPTKGNPTSGDWHTGRQHIFFGKNNTIFNFDNCFFLYSPGKVFGAEDSRVNVSNSVTSFVWHGGEFHRVLLNYKDSHLMNLPNDDHIYVEDIDTDGFHIDYVNPNYPQFSLIENCFFVTGKDDAIDHHSARLKINNCWLEDFTHEGIAASGGDTVMIFNTVALKNDQGFEAGWTENGVTKGPFVIIDHCTAVDNNVGLRIGDSYSWAYRDFMKVTNTVLYNNKDNIRNHLNSTNAPLEGAIDISFSMTNDDDYNSSPFCITGVPQFDEKYFIIPGSPGSEMGTHGTNMGRADSSSVNLGQIVINEIMYNEPGDMQTGDWIELYNPQGIDRDISGWILKDNNNSHSFVFPNGTAIPSKGYLVISADINSFSMYHTNSAAMGGIDFGFGSTDQVRLYNESGLLMDSVTYAASSPWDEYADGQGYSLELLNPAQDHTDHINWKRSLIYGGSPGMSNQNTATGAADKENVMRFYLHQNYPNPFNPHTRILYEVPYTTQVELKIFDMIGREVHTLVDEVKEPGVYEAVFKTGGIASGIYFYRLIAGKLAAVRKMILIK